MRAKVMKVLSTVGAVVVAIVVALLSTQGDDGSATAVSSSAAASATTPSGQGSGDAPADSAVQSRADGVPERAYETLVEIDAGRWPDSADAPGTKGGITFRNREGRLPATDGSGARLTYQEWDVNPKQSGQSRDAERIVTGSDGSAWYTGDHYDSFTRMR